MNCNIVSYIITNWLAKKRLAGGVVAGRLTPICVYFKSVFGLFISKNVFTGDVVIMGLI